jgi:hypothetical protein
MGWESGKNGRELKWPLFRQCIGRRGKVEGPGAAFRFPAAGSLFSPISRLPPPPGEDIIEYSDGRTAPHRRTLMDRELIDRAEAIQQRILQLRDSL